MLEVHQFPCLEDNYGYLVHDQDSGFTAAVDTPETEAIERALKEKSWQLTHILNTHHHFDHAGGNLELKEKTDAVIIGPRADAKRIPGIDIQLGNDDIYLFGKQEMTVFETPGHTSGHCVYYFADSGIIFVGDTLFALGCGRLFEGSAEQMWNSIQKLLTLPDETVVYCAHEYTQANAQFALSIEPKNKDLIKRAAEIDKLRANNQPTIPTTIELERRTNPFMRPNSITLRETIGLMDGTDVEIFAETRQRKDNF
ncbi:MAG: hydroxyacylglutathione hydrolase [Gammaproteobacteria bacterium]|nr:hydroxyacylglutathione hydrolase [Gammaproteobacteria bacterium]MCP4089783.1 hydroxyacylglutathione hydrolase [Gammaproteobacteria bacterium]MCP4278200.1 hydroxyacylglutathione hydrolase [Gammaproteobacteria bacterium]MCP4831919.1 hydroxyacylglutathione hydrolase [Gammaproteobacteria bacterium]MCP4927609.1 hydroxyacylglutathione hydrolase [Gammaproteobacteria bacterium]